MSTWVARVAGALLVAVAAALVVPAVAPPMAGLDRAALVTMLLLVAHGLAGRRRLAAQAGLVLVAIAAVAPPHQPVRLAVLAVAATALWPYRGVYVCRPDPQRLRTACAAALVAVVFVVARGVWMAAWHREPVGRAAHAAMPVLPAAADRSTRVFVLAVFAVVLVALAVALAAAPAPPPAGAAERARVRALVQHPDAGSLAPFATRPDKTYVFAATGDAVIGYRVRFGVALASGDPVGAAGSAAAAVSAFAGLCAVRGWRPAVLGSASAAGDVWRCAGVRRAVGIGDEAILDVATFSLAGRRMRNVRQAVRRAGNAGVRVTIGPLDPASVPRLAPILRDWLRGRRERGFAMNLDAVLVPRPETVVAVAYDRSGEPQAFARFGIVAGGRLLSLDVAPRRRDAPNGVVERLVVATVEHARAHGIGEVSLNFAGMRRVYAGEVRGARLAVVPLGLLDHWIELRSLYRFTAKFQPRWRPRELRMRSWLDVVPVAAAALTAEFGTRAVGRAPDGEQPVLAIDGAG